MKAKNFFISLIVLFFLIPMTAAISLAAVDITDFSGDFVRSTSGPVTETNFFPGMAGPAIITIYNGGVQDSTTERASSSEILVNGVLIFGPDNFNQNVSQLTAVINIDEGQNSLSVTLKGKPGGNIHIDVVQTVDAEAAAWVGSEGGVITVEDINSPLDGLEIEIHKQQ